MTYTYHAKENEVREKATIEKPLNSLYSGSALHLYATHLDEYYDHIASLRRYPCTEACKVLWKDGQEVVEGKDFYLACQNCECRFKSQCTEDYIVHPQSTTPPSTDAIEDELSIYMASKTKHAAKWIALRNDGVNIISTWIDEAGIGDSPDLTDLMHRCITEPMKATFTILYVEPDDFIKCALVEVGAALGASRQVIIVGNCASISPTLLAHKNVKQVMTMKQARMIVDAYTITRK